MPQVTAGVDTEVQGSVALDAFGVLIAKGSFKVQLGTVTELGSDGQPGGTDTAKDTIYQTMVLTLGVDAFTNAQPVQVFIGAGGLLQDPSTPNDFADDVINTDGGVGFVASLNRLSVVTLKNNNATPTQANDDKNYMALELSGMSASLVGIDGLKFGVYQAGVKVNQAKDTDNVATTNPDKIDFSTFFGNTTGLKPATAPQVDATIDTQVQGSVALDAFGVLVAKGSFKVQLGPVTELGTDGQLGGAGTAKDTIYQAMALTLGIDAFTGAQPVQVFIGVGGALQDPNTPNDFSDDVINTDSGVGFLASLDKLSVVTLKNNNATPTQANDDKSYLALDLSGMTAKLVGIDGLNFGVYQAGVKLNQAKQAGKDITPKLDFTTFFNNTAGLRPAAVPQVLAGVDTEVQGSVALDAFGVLVAKGSFKVQLGTVTELGSDRLAGGTGTAKDTIYQAMVLTLGVDAFSGAQPVQVFIGAGGALTDVAGDDGSVSGSYVDDVINTDSGVGFTASLNRLSVVTLKNNNATPNQRNDDKSYMALELSGMTAKLVGIDGLTFGVYQAGVKVNQAKDTDNNPATNPAKLDFTTFFSNTTGLTPASVPQVTAGVDTEVQGSVALDAFGVLIAKGSFKVQLGTVTELGTDRALGGTNTAKDTIYQAMVLTLGVDAFAGAQAVQVFIGAGGSLDDVAGDDGSISGSFVDDVINTDSGIGFSASLPRLSLVTLKNNNATPNQRNDDKSYLALDLNGLTAKLIGIEGLTFGVYQAGVKINQAKDTDNDATTNPAKLDFTTFFNNTTGLVPAAVPQVTAGVDTEVQGSVALDAFGVLIAKGSFKVQLGTVIEKGANQVVGGGDDTTYQAMVLTLGVDAFTGAQPVQVFIGVGGDLKDVNNDDASATGSFADDVVETGIGFSASLNRLSLVSLKDNHATPKDATDDKSYLAVDLSGLSAALIGIDGFTASVTDGIVKVNQASDKDGRADTNPQKLNWATFFSNTSGLTPASIPNVAANVDLLVTGNLTIEIGDFIQIRGGFAFTRSSNLSVTVISSTASGTVTTTAKTVNVVTIGMADVERIRRRGSVFRRRLEHAEPGRDGPAAEARDGGRRALHADQPLRLEQLLRHQRHGAIDRAAGSGSGRLEHLLDHGERLPRRGERRQGRRELRGQAGDQLRRAAGRQPRGRHRPGPEPRDRLLLAADPRGGRARHAHHRRVRVRFRQLRLHQAGRAARQAERRGAHVAQHVGLRLRRRQRRHLRRQRAVLHPGQRPARSGRGRPRAGERQLRPDPDAADGSAVQVDQVHVAAGDGELRRSRRHRRLQAAGLRHHRRAEHGQQPVNANDNVVVDFRASFPDPDGAGAKTAGYALDTGNGSCSSPTARRCCARRSPKPSCRSATTCSSTARSPSRRGRSRRSS